MSKQRPSTMQAYFLTKLPALEGIQKELAQVLIRHLEVVDTTTEDIEVASKFAAIKQRHADAVAEEQKVRNATRNLEFEVLDSDDEGEINHVVPLDDQAAQEEEVWQARWTAKRQKDMEAVTQKRGKDDLKQLRTFRDILNECLEVLDNTPTLNGTGALSSSNPLIIPPNERVDGVSRTNLDDLRSQLAGTKKAAQDWETKYETLSSQIQMLRMDD